MANPTFIRTIITKKAFKEYLSSGDKIVINGYTFTFPVHIGNKWVDIEFYNCHFTKGFYVPDGPNLDLSFVGCRFQDDLYVVGAVRVDFYNCHFHRVGSMLDIDEIHIRVCYFDTIDINTSNKVHLYRVVYKKCVLDHIANIEILLCKINDNINSCKSIKISNCDVKEGVVIESCQKLVMFNTQKIFF